MKFYLIATGVFVLSLLTGCASSGGLQEKPEKEVKSCSNNHKKAAKTKTAKSGVYCGDHEVNDDF